MPSAATSGDVAMSSHPMIEQGRGWNGGSRATKAPRKMRVPERCAYPSGPRRRTGMWRSSQVRRHARENANDSIAWADSRRVVMMDNFDLVRSTDGTRLPETASCASSCCAVCPSCTLAFAADARASAVSVTPVQWPRAPVIRWVTVQASCKLKGASAPRRAAAHGGTQHTQPG